MPRPLEGIKVVEVAMWAFVPAARRRMKIDADTLRSRVAKRIYAVGSGVGQQGPEADRGGYDAITYWAHSGIQSATTPDDADFPLGPPGPAFGADSEPLLRQLGYDEDRIIDLKVAGIVF
jgi:crotonobetainyl-CoA:carnitine CoA-transferase CaiB-like acyl-CoA transferase